MDWEGSSRQLTEEVWSLNTLELFKLPFGCVANHMSIRPMKC